MDIDHHATPKSWLRLLLALTLAASPMMEALAQGNRRPRGVSGNQPTRTVPAQPRRGNPVTSPPASSPRHGSPIRVRPPQGQPVYTPPPNQGSSSRGRGSDTRSRTPAIVNPNPGDSSRTRRPVANPPVVNPNPGHRRPGTRPPVVNPNPPVVNPDPVRTPRDRRPVDRSPVVNPNPTNPPVRNPDFDGRDRRPGSDRPVVRPPNGGVNPPSTRPGTPERRPPVVRTPEGRNLPRPIEQPVRSHPGRERPSHVVRSVEPHPTVTIAPGIAAPRARVITHVAAPRVVVTQPPVVIVRDHRHRVGRVRVHTHHHHDHHVYVDVYHYGGYYWAYHHDHFDHWDGQHHYWWCPHHHVYMDWGYPSVIVEHVYVTNPPPPTIKRSIALGGDEWLYQVGGSFFYWGGYRDPNTGRWLGRWVAAPEGRLRAIGNSVYVRRVSSDGGETQYDRLDFDAELVYSSEYNTYYRLSLRPNPTSNYVYVPEYELWWSQQEQFYMDFLVDYPQPGGDSSTPPPPPY
ncbi:MAG: hypothetical protein HYT79_06885 [Elusimicrobia bacterium]|nr:hypothetical protein [Elusimicrobiota bacterium]